MRDSFFNGFQDELSKIARVGKPIAIAAEAVRSALLPKGQAALRALRAAAAKRKKGQ